jgi:hypothetical protein
MIISLTFYEDNDLFELKNGIALSNRIVFIAAIVPIGGLCIMRLFTNCGRTAGS